MCLSNDKRQVVERKNGAGDGRREGREAWYRTPAPTFLFFFFSYLFSVQGGREKEEEKKSFPPLLLSSRRDKGAAAMTRLGTKAS